MRIDELQKKYPNLPREIIIKWEVLGQGIRDSSVLDKVSEYRRGGHYQSRDDDVTLKGVAEKRPWTARPGYVMDPGSFYIGKKGIGAHIKRYSESPYQIRDLGDGQFALFEGEDKVEDIYFPRGRPWAEQLLTSKGTPVTTLITLERRCFRWAPVRFCEYFTRGEQCKFCNYNATFDDARASGADAVVAIDLEETVEAYKILGSQARLIEGCFQMGALRDSEREANIHLRFLEKIAGAASYVPTLRIDTQPMDRKDLQRLKDAGLSCGNFNVEVWDAELFAEVCPGKTKYRGFERYKEFFLEAVDVLGGGNVGTNFVAGVSLLPPNGPKTWQESRDSTIEGFRWLIKNDVFPTFLGLRLGVGSIYGDDPANRTKLPPTEHSLDLGLAHHELILEYGLYGKLNKLMFCPLDALPHMYCGEIGMLELAGDVGNWASDCVPDDANWIARFISSVKSPAEPRRKPNDPG